MNRRLFLRSSFLLGSSLCLMGLASQSMPQAWVPGHVENNDPNWGILNGAQVAVDETHGVMTAQFTDLIRQMQGRTLTIGGFLMPLDARAQFTHFVLTRRNASCPFCPPNLPTEAIEVFATQPLEYGPDEFCVSGRLDLIQSSSEGLFYKVTNASVRAIAA